MFYYWGWISKETRHQISQNKDCIYLYKILPTFNPKSHTCLQTYIKYEKWFKRRCAIHVWRNVAGFKMFTFNGQIFTYYVARLCSIMRREVCYNFSCSLTLTPPCCSSIQNKLLLSKMFYLEKNMSLIWWVLKKALMWHEVTTIHVKYSCSSCNICI